MKHPTLRRRAVLADEDDHEKENDLISLRPSSNSLYFASLCHLLCVLAAAAVEFS